jgi:hypothetical protein
MKRLLFAGCIFFLLPNCKSPETPASLKPGRYNYDADFLRKHTSKVIELSDANGASKILLSADYQGRVMTSTASGDEGSSFGWINYDLISSHQKKQQFNPVGGEERFWLGPEGGQFSLYFQAKDSFLIKNWQVPAVIDTVTYDVVKSSSSEATFSKKATLINYSGSVFDILIERSVSLLSKADIERKLGASLSDSVKFVGYETTNQIQNVGTSDWTRETGLISIWLLGMMTPTEETTVIIPFRPGADSRERITTSYFGEIPPERLQIKDSVLFFTCDGKLRSKIGLAPSIAKSVAASYDFRKNVLTVILFPVEKENGYVNSKWEIQKEPYAGDAVNSYNDGPLADGSQLGPFYEIESSSAAMELKKGESGVYRQTTCHFQGDLALMNELVKQILGVDLGAVK